jgi:hypothetical protein
MPQTKPSHDIAVDLPFASVREALRGIIIGGILIIAFFPLLGEYGTLLFPLGRDIFFRIIIEILLLSTLLLFAIERRVTFPLSLISMAFTLYIAIAALSTVFSPQKRLAYGELFIGAKAFSLFSIISYSSSFLQLFLNDGKTGNAYSLPLLSHQSRLHFLPSLKNLP